MIDINYYPLEKAKKNNLAHRPIGVGVQGLSDVFMLFKTAFDSDLAKDLNKKIFETIYFGCLTESNLMAEENGKPYDTFIGSPLSKGLFQFDLWGVQPSGIWDWPALLKRIQKHGVYNSLVTAIPPTASTSQIMGNNECIEAITSNIYVRNTMAGDFYVVNKHLMKDLMELGLWDLDMIDLIKYYEGSVQHIDSIPDSIKQIYRTVWEIEQNSIIQMAADRGAFVDQTQSMNISMAKDKFYPPDHYANQPMNVRLTSAHFAGWRAGLKTGMYYLHTKTASDANKFGIDITRTKELDEKYKLIGIANQTDPDAILTPDFDPVVDSDDDDDDEITVKPEQVCRMKEGCVMCSS